MLHDIAWAYYTEGKHSIKVLKLQTEHSYRTRLCTMHCDTVHCALHCALHCTMHCGATIYKILHVCRQLYISALTNYDTVVLFWMCVETGIANLFELLKQFEWISMCTCVLGYISLVHTAVLQQKVLSPIWHKIMFCTSSKGVQIFKCAPSVQLSWCNHYHQPVGWKRKCN